MPNVVFHEFANDNENKLDSQIVLNSPSDNLTFDINQTIDNKNSTLLNVIKDFNQIYDIIQSMNLQLGKVLLQNYNKNENTILDIITKDVLDENLNNIEKYLNQIRINIGIK